jgi:short-subunit dehydrogenase
MSRLTSCKGLTALVTGASSGIGRALALRLARDGARVALVARRPPELEALAAEIRRNGGEAIPLPGDVSDRSAAERISAEALGRLGRVDILFNNAGYGGHRRFLEWDLDDLERMMRVNYLGSVYLTRLLLPQMVERRTGWVVFVASVAGRIGTPEESAYAATKFAVVGLAEALSIEVEDAGVHVLTVCPGVVRTPFFDAEALARLPPVARRRIVEPDELVDAIFEALARGRHELTFPRWLAVGYVVKAVAPELMRRQVKRVTIDALARERGAWRRRGGRR